MQEASLGIAPVKYVLFHSTYEIVLSHFSHIQLFATQCTVACQAPLSMGFSRQKYWSGLPFLSPGDLPNPGIEPVFLMSPALAAGSLPVAPLGKRHERVRKQDLNMEGLQMIMQI